MTKNTPLIAGAVLGAVNASAVCRDVTDSRYAALRYYGFSAGGFMGLFALIALPCTIIKDFFTGTLKFRQAKMDVNILRIQGECWPIKRKSLTTLL